MKNIPCRWIIYQNNNQGFLKLKDEYINALICICPLIEFIYHSFQYMELDASFKLPKLACYFIPLMIKNKCICIGLSTALSEKAELYSRFFQHLRPATNLNIFCDLGNTLEKVCKDFHCQQFLWHRHLIELFNPKSLTGFLTIKICRIKSKESYQNFMEFWIPILNSMIKNKKYPIYLDKFLQILRLEYDNTRETLFYAHPEVKKLWAIWKRGPINSTCSNAVESRHAHLNTLCDQLTRGNLSMESLINKLIMYIINSYNCFTKRIYTQKST